MPDESPRPAPVPDDAVLVHIGMHKTGTTALQGILAEARPDLLEHGVLYPGELAAHHRAARALLRQPVGWQDSADPAPPAEVWDELAASVRQHAGQRVALSSEFFSGADAAQCHRLAADLGSDRVQVVVGVRHLTPIAVSSWQQGLKQGRVSTLDQWLTSNFRRRRSTGTTPFWDRFDPGATVTRWAEALGPDRVTAIVIDERDRSLLPGTVESLLGLPAGLLTERVPAAANRGMTAAEAEMVRLLNDALKDNLTWREYATLVRYGGVRTLVEQRRPGTTEPRPHVPAWVEHQAQGEGRRVLAEFAAAGIRVVGDPEHLITYRPGFAQRHDAVTAADEVPLDAAVSALVGIVDAATQRTQALEEQLRRAMVGGPRINTLTARELAVVLRKRVTAGAVRRMGGRSPAPPPTTVG